MKMATKADSSPETEILEKSNDHGGRVCPKCGTKLGQKNLCPFCSGQNEEKTEAQNDSAATTEKTAQGITPMDRFQQYQQLKKSLADKPKDYLFVLQTVRAIRRDYADYFPLDYINFYAEMYRAKCPFAVFVALMVPEWNTLCRRILRCEWVDGNCAHLCAAPLKWMFLLLSNEEKYNEDLITTIGCRGCGRNEEIRKQIRRFLQSFGEFFKYSFNPVTFSIWDENYLDLLDTSWNRGNPVKPVKLISVYGQRIEGWQEVVPAGKRVLILFCGTQLEISGTNSNPASPENEASVQSEQETSQPGERHIFETYDGLQFRQNENESLNTNAIEHTLLYVVEP